MSSSANPRAAAVDSSAAAASTTDRSTPTDAASAPISAASFSAPLTGNATGYERSIMDGAFAQLEAIFIASDGDERVVLLLDILQQEQKLSFPLSYVRKVG